MSISLMLDQPESVLDESGYSLVHLCRSYWDQLDVTDMIYEPISESVMLEPDYSAGSNALADFETTWGDWREITGPALSDMTGLLQSQVSGVSSAWIDSHKEYERDQAFVLRFYLYEPPPGFLGQAGITLYFGGRYSLRVDADGTGILGRDTTLEWEEGKEPELDGYGTHEWVKQGPLLDVGDNLFGQWHRVIVLPIKGDRILVLGGRGKGFVWREPDVLETTPEVEEGEEEVTYRYASFKAPVRVRGDGGAFALNISTPTYATSGSIASPLLRMPYTATVLPTDSLTLEPRPGLAGSVSVLSEPGGGGLEVPCDALAYSVQVTSSDGHPGVVYDVRVDFPASTRLRSPTAIDAGPYLLELRESCSLRDQSARLRAVIDNADGSFTAKADRCNMRAELTVDGTRRFTGLTGPSSLLPGAAPRWEVEAEDLFKRLRHSILSNQTTYDGQPHTEVVRALLNSAGFPDTELDIAESDYDLPASQGDDGPLFQPRNGETVADFLEYIRESFSGWRMYFDTAGVFHYEPAGTSTSAAAYFSGYTSADGSTQPIFRMSDEIDETGFANEVYVIGMSPGGEVLSAYYLDYRSQNDPTYPQYVGERRLLIWVDTALSSQEAVNWVCRTLADEATQFRRRVRFEGPFVETVVPGDCIDLDGETMRVLRMDSLLVPQVSRTLYEVEPA